MRWGIIIHGPEVMDTGRAQRLLAFFGSEGECQACIGGAMGAIAVIDAGMEEVIDISRREKVTEAMVRLEDTSDAIVILNCAKSRESGIAFGSLLIERLPRRLTKPALQIDNDFIMPMNSMGEELAIDLSSRLELELVHAGLDIAAKGERRIHGVRPGESIWINGNVVGRALDSEAIVWWGDDGILEFKGVEVKASGLDKAVPFDLDTAMIRTGKVRRTGAPPRSLSISGNGEVMLIDHCAEDSFFDTNGASLVISVGDDTTRIAGALMFRKGLPVVGITDGDEDGICTESHFTPGSVIIKLRPGSDDILGGEVRDRFFGESNKAEIDMGMEDLIGIILEMGGDRVQDVLRVGS